MEHDFSQMHHIVQWTAALAVVLLLTGVGCRSASPPTGDVITVTGEVTVRGNEPFAAYILETNDRNLYVLNMDRETSQGLGTPSHVEVTGEVYLDDWNGRPFAHLRVARLTQ